MEPPSIDEIKTLIALLGHDPLPELLCSPEPAARWLLRARFFRHPCDDTALQGDHRAVLQDQNTQELIARLPDWESPARIGGHDSPAFTPNLLSLLHDMGVGPADEPRIAESLQKMLLHRDPEGRFCTLAGWRGMAEPRWGALLCDTHAITEALARGSHVHDPRVSESFARMEHDLVETAQGRGWPCRPEPSTGFRGPGRKADACPQVALEALRALSYLPSQERPEWAIEAARLPLSCWRGRKERKPYMFGHGERFRRGKWPQTWYSALAVVDTLGRWPELWSSAQARPEDRQALVEILSGLVRSSVDPKTGLLTPASCYKGFEAWSFGQKKRPSHFATVKLLVALGRVPELCEEAVRQRENHRSSEVSEQSNPQ